VTVYQRVRATGSFEVQLDQKTPPSIRSHLIPFSTIVIYPARALPNRLSDATFLVNALFSGVLLEPPGTDGKIAGASLAWWMGDSDNKGSVIAGAISGTAQSLSTWITALMPAQLAAGTVTSPGGSLTNTYQWVTRRQAIDSVCDAFGVEWRVNPNGTVDVGTAATLYGSSPRAITSTRGGSSSDATLVGLGSDVTVSFNYQDYASLVYVSGKGGMAGAGGAGVYRGPDSGLATIIRVVDDSNAAAGTEGTIAAADQALWSSDGFQRDIKVSSPRQDMPRVLPAGSTFYLYAPDVGLVDTGNVVRYEGTAVFPVSTRALGVRWPIVSTFGVYNRYWDGSTWAYDDLSDYVAYETSAAEIEVG